MILIIDNYDSFTYNLEQAIGEFGISTRVVRNDMISVDEVSDMSPRSIIISPGPGSPSDSGVSLDLIQRLAHRVPILGVCLGHQAIASMFGCDIVHSPEPIHGKTSLIYHDSKGLFDCVPNPFIGTRYHSLTINPLDISENILATAWTDSGVIMACQHKDFPKLQGIQFHPESLWTSQGKQLLCNFVEHVY
uniref:Anthranilate synthase component II n=1 Tax=Nemalion vermiculare TaxID=935621 RepID=UPI00257F745A|nr:Anthranilate synthase component II [Nemalion vermiculare]WGV34385.1 Anthranilate synthase component II [Nemalion vermiculare]